MKRFLKEKILHNIWMKLLSLVLAILAWCAIMNSSDPTITSKISNIKVARLNEDAVIGDGDNNTNKTPTFIKGEKISVKVSGPRSEITKLKAQDVVAYIDLQELSKTNSCPIHVKLKSSDRTKNCEITYKSEEVVLLSIENMSTEKKQVKCDIVGRAADGYYPVPNVSMLVDVHGPTKVVSTIDHVAATVDVTGSNKTITISSPLVAYDANNNKIEDSSIIINNNENVKIEVILYKTKEVDIVVDADVVADQGFICGDVNYAPNSVIIAGDDSVLRKVDAIHISCKSDKQKEDYHKDFSIKENLIEGCYLVSENDTVSVQIPVVRSVNKEFNIANSKIRTDKLASDYEIVYPEEFIKIGIRGTKEDVDALLEKNIRLYVDCSLISSEGEHELELHASLPDKLTLSKTLIKVNIVKKGDGDPEK